MAKPWIWVGLDTNAAAGRNGSVTNAGTNDIEVFVTHNSMAEIVARSHRDANCGS